MSRFEVHGNPVPQGSLRAFVRGERAVLTYSGGATLGAWRQAVAASCAALGEPMTRGPVEVELEFTIRRPRGHYGACGLRPRFASPYPLVAPDLDKLVRAVLDALSGIAYVDDRQVVTVVARKRYGERPGLLATVSEVLR